LWRAHGWRRNGRCRLHGGLSTGPRTEAGRRRLAELGKARAEAALLAEIERERLADLAQALRIGIPATHAEELANANAAHRRRQHEEYEATIARYLALGHTRAYARRFMRMDRERASWLYQLRWGRELP
jgi:hypothetical protein